MAVLREENEEASFPDLALVPKILFKMLRSWPASRYNFLRHDDV